MRYFAKGEKIKGNYLVQDVKTGGMGIVYLCHHESNEEPVALKTFQLKSPDLWSSMLGSFVREAKTWILIGEEPNVVQAYYILNVEMDGSLVPHLAMECVEGRHPYGCSLLDWMRKGAIDLKCALLFSSGVCAGMNQIRRRLGSLGIAFVHRDLKPQNILITSDGIAKITDFGLSKSFEANAAIISSGAPAEALRSSHVISGLSGNTVFGTPPYMSPEQCIGGIPLDQRSDIYSFGCILYEMCTGHLVFEATSAKEFIQNHIQKKPLSPCAWIPGLPAALVSLVQHCLEKNPKERPRDFTDISAALKPILADLGNAKPILYFLCGLSAFTDRPRVRRDWKWDKATEAVILGKPFGVDYLIKEGLVKDKAEWESLWNQAQENEPDAKKRIIQQQIRKRERDADEFVLMGDALRALAENPDCLARIKLFEDALDRYRAAQRKLPSRPQIGFRLAMTYRDIAELIRSDARPLSDGMLTVAFEELSSIISTVREPVFFCVNEEFYVLPYHALMHRAATCVMQGDAAQALKDTDELMLALGQWDEEKYQGLRDLIKDQAAFLRADILKSRAPQT